MIKSSKILLKILKCCLNLILTKAVCYNIYEKYIMIIGQEKKKNTLNI